MLRDILLDWILFTFWETLLMVLFIFGKKLWKKSIFLAFTLSIILSTIFCLTQVKIIPFLNQIISLFLISLGCYIFLRENYFKVLIQCVIVYALIFMLDSFVMFIALELISNNISENIIYISMVLIPSKILEFFIVLHKEEILMKLTWGSIERR